MGIVLNALSRSRLLSNENISNRFLSRPKKREGIQTCTQESRETKQNLKETKLHINIDN